MRDVTTTYLEMFDPAQLCTKVCPEPLLTVGRCIRSQPAMNRFLNEWVGRQWNWKERLSWSETQWTKHAEDENVRTWIAYQQGNIVGYFELNKADDDVEIRYFGLTLEFIGNGYGGYLLTEAILRAWQWDAKRV